MAIVGMIPSVCPTCYGMVAPGGMEQHEQWHDRIAQVAIDNTRRIEQLERRVQELEAGYGDQ